ncbi:nuclear pore complex protein Nup88, partial [Asbolus verrucosus]
SHSLDERLLFCSDVVKVRQVRFHPGSPRNTHILILTSDNTLRFYCVENSTALSLATYPVGETPIGVFPGTKTSYLAAFGEVGVDFDFGLPELDVEAKSLFIKEKKFSSLLWPVYVLRGDGSVYTINIPLDQTVKPTMSGPIPKNISQENPQEEACSIICINTNPEVLCIANSNGAIYHSILLPIEDEEYENVWWRRQVIFAYFHLFKFQLKKESKNAPKKELLCFESIELELGLSTTNDDMIGFSLYYEPTSLIAILADGSLLSLGILTAEILPRIEELQIEEEKTDVSSPLKKMLREPFDHNIQKILKRSSNQPILKLGGDGKHSQKECYEVGNSEIFCDCISNDNIEYFENHTRSREEIEKRIKALQMMKEFELKHLERINVEKHQLQEKAENLAEKYEDIKDKQDEIMRRCEKLLILVSQKKAEPSDAEKKFLKELEQYMDKIEMYKKSIEKLKMKVKYQKIQMTNWKAQEQKRVSNLSETHSTTIKNNLKETSEKITEMVKQVNEYKERLNLK